MSSKTCDEYLGPMKALLTLTSQCYLALSTKRDHCYHMLDQEIKMLKSQQLLLPVYGQLMKRMEKWPSTMMSLK